MKFLDKFNSWVENEYFDEETRKELSDIKDDNNEIEDRFYKDLEFGTGGLRGKIGAGTNRINKYTVAKATQGFAEYLLENNDENKSGVVIAYDSRYKSDEFALTAALVLAGNGIKAYLFDELKPTPELSFAVSYYGIDVIDVLTGFKFIGEKIEEFEHHKTKEFLFGYEESFGYLSGTFVRDKDAVISSMLIVEMAAYYKGKGLSLYEALEELYRKYGYFIEDLHSITLEGIEGTKKINEIMECFREDYPIEIGSIELARFNDYKNSISIDLKSKEESKIDLPKSNVLKYVFDENSWYAFRPSGTEPKLKIYMSARGENREIAINKLNRIRETVIERMEAIGVLH